MDLASYFLYVPQTPRFSIGSEVKKPVMTKNVGMRKLWMKAERTSKT